MQGLVEGCARIETFPPGHLYDSKSGTTRATSSFSVYLFLVFCVSFTPRNRSPNPLPSSQREECIPLPSFSEV